MNTQDTITVLAGIVSINGLPQLRFASSAQAGIFLMRLGYKVTLKDDTQYTFQK